VPVSFYEPWPHGGLYLTDAAFRVFEGDDARALDDELGARWDLLEAEFELKREPGNVANDLRTVYLARGYERTSVTHLAPVLHGYQEGPLLLLRGAVPPASTIALGAIFEDDEERGDAAAG